MFHVCPTEKAGRIKGVKLAPLLTKITGSLCPAVPNSWLHSLFTPQTMAAGRRQHQLQLRLFLLAAALACSLHAAAESTDLDALAVRHKPSKPRPRQRHRPGGGRGTGSGMAACNMFQGSWVYDDTLPMYDTARCPFVEPEFDCQKYGRPDKLYLKYRWRPASCELPRFNGQDLLSKWRGKKILFVGDSISLNQWQSLVCMLHAAAPASGTTHSRGNPVSTVTFQPSRRRSQPAITRLCRLHTVRTELKDLVANHGPSCPRFYACLSLVPSGHRRHRNGGSHCSVATASCSRGRRQAEIYGRVLCICRVLWPHPPYGRRQRFGTLCMLNR
ncbi:uncharacterized protein LOC100834496 isoform X2 [Brachypodium distachyon]|uniref:uncharacterized protein LOC100834496 isoform X2 n=1 Tax=Brachypodium distachyon TaxID=15368 RepID=UPI000D0D1336|nr:uncharacterized protein LOC100834496 isoform X2 [Brachypodium distachyon]|eukprot:XP_024315994.1 uncharacterized protein LOC100834496 isoform X2 [Brachypodium distachyon]